MRSPSPTFPSLRLGSSAIGSWNRLGFPGLRRQYPHFTSTRAPKKKFPATSTILLAGYIGHYAFPHLVPSHALRPWLSFGPLIRASRASRAHLVSTIGPSFPRVQPKLAPTGYTSCRLRYCILGFRTSLLGSRGGCARRGLFACLELRFSMFPLHSSIRIFFFPLTGTELPTTPPPCFLRGRDAGSLRAIAATFFFSLLEPFLDR